MTRVLPMTPQSFTELDVHLGYLEQNLEFDLDPEVAQSIGPDKVNRSAAKVALLRDIRALIAPVVADEQRAVTEDAVEAQYKDAGYDSLTPLEQRLLDGDR